MKKYCIVVPMALLSCMMAVLVLASTPEQRKSRHITLRAIQASVEHTLPEAHEMFKRAYELDPGNNEAAYAYGISLISMAQDSAQLHNGLSLVRQYVDAYPEDYDETSYYAYLCRRIGIFDESQRVLTRLSEYYPDKSELLASLAEIATLKDDRQTARDYYTRFEKIEGQSPDLSLRKMALWLQDKDTASAIGEADRLIAASPAIPDFYVLKGNLYAFLNKPDSALGYYKRAEAIAPEDGAVKLSLVNFYNENGDTAAYDREVYSALLLDDIDLDVKLQLLAEYVTPLLERKGNTEHADYLLSALRDQYPHEAGIQDFSSRFSAAKHNWKEAVEQIQIAIDMDPTNKGYKAQKVSYLVADERYEEAIREYEAARDTANPQIEMFFYGVAAYTGAERDKEALAESKRVLKLIMPNVEPTDTLTEASGANLNSRGLKVVGTIYSLMGDIYFREKDMPNVNLMYTNALRLNPDDASALNNYAYYLSESGGDLDTALKISRKAIDEDPENSSYLDTYAWILFRKQDYKEALEYQEKAMKFSEGPSVELYEHLGDIQFMNGLPEDAVKSWEQGLMLDPDNKLLQKKVKHKTYFYE